MASDHSNRKVTTTVLSIQTYKSPVQTGAPNTLHLCNLSHQDCKAQGHTAQPCCWSNLTAEAWAQFSSSRTQDSSYASHSSSMLNHAEPQWNLWKILISRTMGGCWARGQQNAWVQHLAGNSFSKSPLGWKRPKISIHTHLTVSIKPKTSIYSFKSACWDLSLCPDSEGKEAMPAPSTQREKSNTAKTNWDTIQAGGEWGASEHPDTENIWKTPWSPVRQKSLSHASWLQLCS